LRALPTVPLNILIRPGIQFKPVETDPLNAHWNLSEQRPYFGAESVLVHAEIARCVSHTDDARQQD
jgi:hypothetical protein